MGYCQEASDYCSKAERNQRLKSDSLQIGQILQIPDRQTTVNNSSAGSDELASRGNQTRMDSLIKFATSLLGSKYRYGGSHLKVSIVQVLYAMCSTGLELT